jgi:hypothetical protein
MATMIGAPHPATGKVGGGEINEPDKTLLVRTLTNMPHSVWDTVPMRATFKNGPSVELPMKKWNRYHKKSSRFSIGSGCLETSMTRL